MATSGSSSVKVTGNDTLKFSWERTGYSIENNTSTVKWKMELIAADGGAINSSVAKAWGITINGENYTGTNTVGIGNSTTKTLASGTVTISHNTDGSKTFSYSFSQQFKITFSGTYIDTKTGTGSGTLNTIPRQATITAAPNFNDEDNPTITYSNPAGSAVTSLDACISFTGAADDIAYRDISKTGSSYTFNLTDAERKVLREAITSGNSKTVRFYVRTKIGDNLYHSYISKTLSLVNYTPTLNPTVKDTGINSTKLTGNPNRIIRYFNSMTVNSGATARKEATIKSQKVTAGVVSINYGTGKLNNVDSGKFVFSVTDSRGYTTTKTVTLNTIPYVKLTCNMSAKAALAADNTTTATVNISGNYYNASFGAVDNSLGVFYRYRESGGEYGEWIATTATFGSNNTYEAIAEIKGLDYQKSYDIEAKATDAINTSGIITAPKTVQTIPIFDWSNEDFAFHTSIYMDNAKQLYGKTTEGQDLMMISLNASNQSFFGYGGYNNNIGSTYFDGNSVYIRSKNNVNISATGTINGNKAYTNTSDKRLKGDIGNIPTELVTVWLELTPRVFKWNELNGGGNNEKWQLGLIAQEVIETFTKYGLDYTQYGFVETIEVDEVEYFALTYEFYNMLTAEVLRDTVGKLASLEKDITELKNIVS